MAEPPDVLFLRLHGPGAIVANMPDRWWPFHDLHILREPAAPFGRKGLAIAAAWADLADKGPQRTAGLVLLDCDVVIDPWDYSAMCAAINADPGIVHTAPVLIWPKSTKRPRAIWSHKTGFPQEEAERDDGPDTDPRYRFSNCFTYMPRALVEACVKANMRAWKYPGVDMRMHQLGAKLGVPVHVVRGCTPKHLNW
jgi:hypothetical protein